MSKGKISDIQNSINERPLTYNDEESKICDIITPNSFLRLGHYQELSFGSLDGAEISAPNRKDLIKTLSRRDNIFEALKENFYNDYLLSLRETSRKVYEGNWSETLKRGDIVLIYSPVKSRINWPLGCVTEVLTGNDGKTRCVKLRRSNQKEEVHPVNHIYPLELSLEHIKPPSNHTDVSHSPNSASISA